MASKQRRRGTYAPPAVKAGDVIRVHVPQLEGLWLVVAVLESPSGDRFLRIQATIDGVKQTRTISPRGFEVVGGGNPALAEVRARLAELEARAK